MGTRIAPYTPYIPDDAQVTALQAAGKDGNVDQAEATALGLTDFQRDRANEAAAGRGVLNRRGIGRDEAVEQVYAWASSGEFSKAVNTAAQDPAERPYVLQHQFQSILLQAARIVGPPPPAGGPAAGH